MLLTRLLDPTQVSATVNKITASFRVYLDNPVIVFPRLIKDTHFRTCIKDKMDLKVFKTMLDKLADLGFVETAVDAKTQRVIMYSTRNIQCVVFPASLR